MAQRCFVANTWQNAIYTDVWDLMHDCGPRPVVDEVAHAYFEDWSDLYDDHWNRPSYLELRTVIRYALRTKGVPTW